jgi:glycosyltransferase involved in cell wall biosynthesis
MSTVPRILASAYACRPGLGSEDGNGWELTRQLRRIGEVWVITPSHNRPAIAYAQAHGDLLDVHFEYVDVPRWPADSPRAIRFRRTHYNLWQRRILRTAKRLHREIGFDAVQHLTYAQYWSGSWMTQIGPPLVWGPVGGGESAPAPFVEAMDAAGQRYERNRDFARKVGKRYPIVARCAKKSTTALSATPETRLELERLGATNITMMPPAGLPDRDFAQLAALPLDKPAAPFRVLCVGRLEHWKGFQLAVAAMPRLLESHPDSELWIIGEGPADEHLRAVAEQHGVTHAVTLLGRVPRPEVLERLRTCHVLAHPSYHDSAGWATMEAMAAGLPVVCLDLGGPAVQVTDQTGFVLPAETPEQAIADIGAAFARLANEPELVRTLGAAGRARIGELFTWSKLGDRIANVEPYRTLRQR